MGIQIKNTRSIEAKSVNGNKEGISYIIEFDNGVSYVCRLVYNSKYIMPETFIQLNESVTPTLCLETREINEVMNFLRHIENGRLSWVKCCRMGNVNLDILELI